MRNNYSNNSVIRKKAEPLILQQFMVASLLVDCQQKFFHINNNSKQQTIRVISNVVLVFTKEK